LAKTSPVIVLGGRGYIGREVAAQLQDKFGENVCYGVDINTETNQTEGWPEHLRGQPALLVNVSRANALSAYIDKSWDTLVILNEVYPAPKSSEVNAFSKKGLSVYHVSGIAGWVLPSFPGAYQGAIPCCASWHSSHIDVVVANLSPNEPESTENNKSSHAALVKSISKKLVGAHG